MLENIFTYDKYQVAVDNEEKFVFTITYKDAPDERKIAGQTTISRTQKTATYKLINGALNGALKNDLYAIVELIGQDPGMNRKSLAEIFGKGSRTIDRHLKILKDAGIIERLGSDKTGGYYLTSVIKEQISTQGV